MLKAVIFAAMLGAIFGLAMTFVPIPEPYNTIILIAGAIALGWFSPNLLRRA